MRTGYFALFLVLVGCVISAVARAEPCDSSATYEKHNMTDYGPIEVSGIQGIAIDSSKVSVPSVCIALFTEQDHTFVGASMTSNDGKFAIANVKPGKYRVIAKLGPFCTANIPVLVKRHESKQLRIQMRPAGIDSCSFGEGAKAKS